MAELRIVKISLRYLSILFGLLSISFSQNPTIQDGFTFIFPEKGYEGTPLAFEVKPPDSEQYIYLWYLGHSYEIEFFNIQYREDRSLGPKVNFTYPGQGRNNGFEVKVEVYKDKITRTPMQVFEKFLPVYNVPPKVSIEEAPAEGFEGEELYFKASHTDPGASDKHEYFWNFNGVKTIGPSSSYKNTNNTTYTYRDNGLYTIYVIAQDDDNDADTAYHQINIKNIAPELESITHSEIGNEGERISFSVNYFDQGLSDLHTFMWDFGDGELDTAFNNIMDHVYLDDDEFNIQLIVKDNSNDADTISSKIFIKNISPKIKATIPGNGDEGTPVSFSLSIKDEGKNDTHNISWDMGDGSTNSAPTFTHSYKDNGEYTINISVEDDDGGKDSWVQKIKIFNLPPTLEFSIPDSSFEGQAELFNVNAEDKGANDKLTFLWSFGDGSTDSNKQASYKYLDDGQFNVFITVKDNDGGTTTLNQLIDIKNVAPILKVTIPKKKYEGSKIDIIAEVESDPGLQDKHVFQFSYGDGTVTDKPYHIYQDNGEFEIQVVLDDGDGGRDTLSQSITIVNLPPKILGTLIQEANEGELLDLNLSVEDPGNMDTHSYYWDFGDGSSDSVLQTQHIFDDDGKYELLIKVTDDDGAVDSMKHEITISNLPPTLSASFVSSSKVQIPQDQGGSEDMGNINQSIDITEGDSEQNSPTGDKDATVFFNAMVVDSGKVDTHTFIWDFGDGTSSTEAKVEHTYTSNGIFPVSIIAMDDDRGSDTLSQTITITNVTPAMVATLLSPDSLYQSAIILPLDLEGAEETNTYSWDFGDGDTSSYSLPTHAYSTKGDFLITARINDANSYTALNIQSIEVGKRSPQLKFIDKESLIDSGESDKFFSEDIFSISSPRQRFYKPNSFPTIIFTVQNYSDIETDINLNLIMPEGWDIISLVKPSTLKPNSMERVRLTFKVPYNENADELYKIKLITKIGNYDHMVSILSAINIKIKENPAFQLEAYREIEEIYINKAKDIKYILRNTGNVTDTYDLQSIIPDKWELISSEKQLEILPDKSQEFKIQIKTPKKIDGGLEEEVSVTAYSQKIKSSAGKWFDAIEGREGICSDAYPAYCSISSRDSEEECIAESIWYPKIEGSLEHCSDSLFTNKLDCERFQEWINPIIGISAACSDTTFTLMTDCIDNREVWNAGSPDIAGYCTESSIDSKDRCIKSNTWSSTVRGESAYCKSFPNRKTENDCISIGEWFIDFPGTLPKESCLEERIWHPQELANEEYCTESYWGNKEDCEYISEWILSQNIIPAHCENEKIFSKEICIERSQWIEETPAVKSYCLDGISKNLVDCNSPGEWFPELLSNEAFCTDTTITIQQECEKILSWTPKIESKDAYCTDQVSLIKDDCVNPPGIKKSATVNLFSRLKSSKGKSKAMFAYIPILIGMELGNLSTTSYPSFRFFFRAPIIKLGPYKTWFNYSQRYDQYEIIDSLETSENTTKYFNEYTIDKYQFYLSRGSWETLIGDNFIDKYELITNLSPIPVFGLNGSESFRGAFFKYKFNTLNLTLLHGSGPSFNNQFKLSSISLSHNYSEDRNSFYSLYYHNKIDSTSSLSHFISVQRIDNAISFNNGQILALTQNASGIDGAVQFIFDYTADKFKLVNRIYHFGDGFDDFIKGRTGTGLSAYLNITERLYNFSRIEIYNQNLFETTPIYISENFEDCGLDLECNTDSELVDDGENNQIYDDGEFFIDSNENGIFDIDTTYIEKVFVSEFNSKIFYEFNNGIRISSGLKHKNEAFSNGLQSIFTEYDTRIGKSFQIHNPYFSANFSTDHEMNYEKISKTQLRIGNRSIWNNLNLNFTQNITFPYLNAPIDYSTTIDSRFKMFSLDWNFIFQVNNLCPLCTGEKEKGVISTLALENTFLVNFMGIQNRLKLGLGYSPSSSGLNFTFGIIPSGGARTSKITLPVPLIKIKGRYSGEMYIDENSNDIRDVNEKGIPNLMLFINGYISVTDENGFFEFGALDPGQYQLKYDSNTLDAKYKFKDNFPRRIVVTTGDKIFDSFPVSSVCKIRGVLFIDSDLDKIKDQNENTVKGAKIIVQSTSNDETIIYTDTEGRYEIPDLKTGIYNLIIDPEWLPERTVSTYSLDSKKSFTKLGWTVTVSNDNSNIEFNIPINEKELEVRIDVINDSNINR